MYILFVCFTWAFLYLLLGNITTAARHRWRTHCVIIFIAPEMCTVSTDTRKATYTLFTTNNKKYSTKANLRHNRKKDTTRKHTHTHNIPNVFVLISKKGYVYVFACFAVKIVLFLCFCCCADLCKISENISHISIRFLVCVCACERVIERYCLLFRINLLENRCVHKLQAIAISGCVRFYMAI